MSDGMHPHDGLPVLSAGMPLAKAEVVLILLHGRGASADDILTLHDLLDTPNLAVLAPQAAESTWYPNRFIEPLEHNEPHLSSALRVIDTVVMNTNKDGIPFDHMVLGGFSQGACLACEYTLRNPRRYGGLIVFSGAYIGPPGQPRQPQGDLNGMPVFIGCSDTDPHIPLERVHETSALLRATGAIVNERIYKNMGHTISGDEIDHANNLLRAVSKAKTQ